MVDNISRSRFERAIVDKLTKRNIIPAVKEGDVFFTTFGRTALYLILKSIDCEDKEVLLPAFTCPESVVNIVIDAGAVPVFVDVDPFTLNFDYTDLRKKISNRTIALVSHHYFGMVNCYVNENWSFAKEYGLVHIEDCCHSMGAKFLNKPIGFASDISFFSFAKTFTAPGGGFVLCNSQWLLKNVKKQLIKCDSGLSYSTLIIDGAHIVNYGYTLWVLRNLMRVYDKSPFRLMFKLPKAFFAVAVCIARLLNNYYSPGKEDGILVGAGKIQLAYINFVIDGALELLKRRKENKLIEEIKSISWVLKENNSACSFNDLYVIIRGNSDLINKVDFMAERLNVRVHLPWVFENCFYKEQQLPGVMYIRDTMRVIDLPLVYKIGDLNRIREFLLRLS